MSEPVFLCKSTEPNIFFSCFQDAISFVQVYFYVIQLCAFCISPVERTADTDPQWLDLLIILCEDIQVQIILLEDIRIY